MYTLNSVDGEKAPGQLEMGYCFYFPKYNPRREDRKKYRREDGFIWMSTHKDFNDEWRMYSLAHEVGHALDDYRKHPAQKELAGYGRGRYRIEAAAVGYGLVWSHFCDMDNEAYDEISRHGYDYVDRYKRPEGCPGPGMVGAYCWTHVKAHCLAIKALGTLKMVEDEGAKYE